MGNSATQPWLAPVAMAGEHAQMAAGVQA